MSNKFNIHECEGRRDGATGKGWLLAFQYMKLRNIREAIPGAPILVVYEENYNTYKQAFLKAFWNAKRPVKAP